MKLGERIYTGIGNRTIPNPATLHSWDKDARTFQGDADDYNFDKQTENYKKLSAVLNANGLKFAQVAAAHYEGDSHTNHRFVVTTAGGELLWHKYVGYAAASGQNHVFVAGMRVKVSHFLVRSAAEQHALLSGDKRLIESVFDEGVLGDINDFQRWA